MLPPEDFRLPPDNREGPNCGITAIAVVSGASFEHVWQIVASRKPGNWKGSMSSDDIARALKHLKVRYRSFSPGAIQVRHFKPKPGVTYLVSTYDHMMVLRDGVLLDQRGHFSASEERRHIQRIYEVRP